MQIVRRWIGILTQVNPQFIQKGELSRWAEVLVRNAVQEIIEGGAPVILMAGDMDKGVDGIERLMDEHSPDAVYIDAAYLLSPSMRAKRVVAKWEQLSEVMKELKQLGVRKNRAINITVQFNRNVRSSADAIKPQKKPELGDIGGSDSLPQDASVVDGIRHGPNPFQRTQRIHDVLKNREGATGEFATRFSFTPCNYDEVPLIETNASGEVVPVNTEWMV